MVIVSINGKKILFAKLNAKSTGSFCFQSIFDNLRNVPMYPKNILTTNFLLFMKYYLLEIEEEVNTRTKDVPAD